MIGQTISHYRITDKLGEGGMGVVWKARDIELERFVALKTLPSDRVADESRRARFLHEARAASALNHTNIVTIHDLLHDGGASYLVMECVDGKSLDQVIPRKGMRLNEALKLAIQVADALTVAHKIGLVHRDLKPGNVMVTPSGHVKVLDFGLAKLMEPSAPSEDGPTRTVSPATEEGVVVGTVSYMSPEQAEGRQVDTRSDIFAFGALLYEMVTGQRAFQGGSKLSTLSAILKEEPRPIPGAPRDLEKILSRCLRKYPERRAQHIGDVKLALEELEEDSESGVIAPAAASRAKRRWLWPVLAMLAVGAGIYFVRQTDRNEAAPFVPTPLTRPWAWPRRIDFAL